MKNLVEGDPAFEYLSKKDRIHGYTAWVLTPGKSTQKVDNQV